MRLPRASPIRCALELSAPGYRPVVRDGRPAFLGRERRPAQGPGLLRLCPRRLASRLRLLLPLCGARPQSHGLLVLFARRRSPRRDRGRQADQAGASAVFVGRFVGGLRLSAIDLQCDAHGTTAAVVRSRRSHARLAARRGRPRAGSSGQGRRAGVLATEAARAQIDARLTMYNATSLQSAQERVGHTIADARSTTLAAEVERPEDATRLALVLQARLALPVVVRCRLLRRCAKKTRLAAFAERRRTSFGRQEIGPVCPISRAWSEVHSHMRNVICKGQRRSAGP